MWIKGAASWGLNEARLWVLRLMEGLPDTGSNPAQMGIEVSYNNGVPRENNIECVSGVKQIERDLTRVGLMDVYGGGPRQGVTRLMKDRARYVGCTCRINYCKVCRK